MSRLRWWAGAKGSSTSAIVAEVSGQVSAIVAPEGNPIKRGETLIEIDPTRMRFDLMAKEGEFIEAREQHDLAKKNLKRSEELFALRNSSAISRWTAPGPGSTLPADGSSD
jgi:multidrug resistance efflux pump